MQKNKKFILGIALIFLAAGCNFFSSSLPAGVMKSTNGGADWQFSNAIKGNSAQSLVSLSISKMAFAPSNRETVYAGSYTSGLFKSEDSGANWSKILSNVFVYDFAISPGDPKIIYAAGYFADHGRVVKTTDGGASWNQVYNEESTLNAVRAIAINPNNPNQIIIGTTSGSIIKSADGGISWQLARNFSDRVNRMLWQNGNIYVLLKAKGLFKSTGFAENFDEVSSTLSKTYNLGSLSYTSSTIDSFSQLYVDYTTPGLIYVTTNKGLFKTVDDGKNWQQLQLPVKAEDADARAVAIAPSSSNIVFTSVGSTIYKSTDGGQTFQTQSKQTAGFINYILIDPQLPQIVYAGVYSSQ
ncbi:MAG: hypothetical protein HY918_02355 [Candidatus Doudnabacteria bacterium]|nr:hypothetical protein [Candidatus Doudnabacteria bacterium]